MFVKGMWCYFTGWGVSIRNGVLVNGLCVTFRDGMFVKGMWCYFTGWGISIRTGVLVNGMGCNFPR